MSVGQACGEAAGNLQTDAGAAAAGGASSQTFASSAAGREEEPQRLHEEERRVHQPAGAGEREVRVDQTTSLVLTQTVGVFIQSKTHAFV